mmetsp:Transcript_5218/g.10189  ORF Transcript_5218/g.10189 Transcript_5218/m.10189 type:complete len:457 (-) Transcript_5218:7316-8686(-)
MSSINTPQAGLQSSAEVLALRSSEKCHTENNAVVATTIDESRNHRGGNHPTNLLFQLHFQKSFSTPPPMLSLGMLQWGTTPIDHRILNGSRGVLTESQAREIYQAFRSRGVVLFDTAEGYGGGTSEKRLGRLWKEEVMERKINCSIFEGTVDTTATEKDDQKNAATSDSSSEVLLMTKFLPAPWRFTHGHFEKALRASNKRMGISKCHIYLLHSPMHLSRGVEYWVESAAICRKKGLMDTLGLSNCSADEVRTAVLAGEKYGVPVVLNQVHFSLLDYNSDALHDMQNTCQELGVSIVAYNSLGQGLLTDDMNQEKLKQNKPARMMKIAWDDLAPLRIALRKIADAHSNNKSRNVLETRDISMAQVALNWCRAHHTIPLVGCRSIMQAEDTLASLEWELNSEEVAELDTLALNRCTLDSPVWKRKLFVVLASVVMSCCQWMDFLGMGIVKQAAIGMK